MENQTMKKYKMEKQPKKIFTHSKAKHPVKHPEDKKKFNCNQCNYSSSYKYNLSRHTELKHPVKYTKKTLKKSKSYSQIKLIKCFCKHMFYTIQNSLKKTKPRKKSATTKYGDQQ